MRRIYIDGTFGDKKIAYVSYSVKHEFDEDSFSLSYKIKFEVSNTDVDYGRYEQRPSVIMYFTVVGLNYEDGEVDTYASDIEYVDYRLFGRNREIAPLKEWAQELNISKEMAEQLLEKLRDACCDYIFEYVTEDLSDYIDDEDDDDEDNQCYEEWLYNRGLWYY